MKEKVRPIAPTRKNRERQPKRAVIQNRTGLRKARPKYCPTEYTPVALARSCCGNQMLSTRLLQGNAGASATPSTSRETTREAIPTANPCVAVMIDHRAIDRKYV